MTEEIKRIDIQQIMELLPHRFPFLLVDRVLDYTISDEKKTLKAIKNVSYDEPYFQGHFPVKPVLPGVLILESMAQATGILAFTMVGKPNADELYYFASVENAKFRKPVIPGDQMVLDVEFLKERRGIARFTGVASVDGDVVCSAELMCAKVKI
ncbi:MAG: 3-hydroxyacyl-ACP dehydratase FabZ [Succinivibrionaceae bacterium]|nr:3-hydroxyacyl-ACP dehydratase FabZ [Succinivibrionaceae bacterium]MCI6200476.1 3-hydroxyacyl-ACP dehydratase FabZ [Pseudomonadota bacterium]MDD6545002.1 3-hydroxyacyl-ACP dehydratase FabZ [Pseudomonadota bacterium]MDY3145932.1 3-hydroxyacyl-ACP dehydratase FabZ [Succinivibrionaceae bacterium]MDY6273722.1 3-hydroxyacyl-ACP dehydratase FabZ [Succinivibrionaceae bacterium]